MSSPWAKIEAVENPRSLLEITSEQYANQLQEKEYKNYTDKTACDVLNEENVLSEESNRNVETEDDEVIAYILQAQFNQEHDTILSNTEKKFNGDSKVSISYSNYRTSFEKEEEQKVTKEKDFDRFVSLEREIASMPRCGYKKVQLEDGLKIVTKHDIVMSSRMNACRVLQFPPGIHTGDTGGFDLKLNNRVFNSLRCYSQVQSSRQKGKKPRPHNK